MAGQTLQTPAEIGNILLTARDGRPVYVRDVANVLLSSGNAEHRVSNVLHTPDGMLAVPAVSLAIAKRPGTNAVVISEHIVERLEQLKGQIIPEDVTVDITRNYGETANEKANELLFHLALATISIVILVALSIGWREAIVVAIVIPTTILLTLFAARLMGYTLNRVSLFALIFSIGILVDDAIVVIENIARHWAMKDGRSRVARRHRCGGGSRQPDDRRDAHRGGRPAAHALRVGPDGPLHEPHSGQCLGGHDLLLLRRRHGDALADDETCTPPMLETMAMAMRRAAASADRISLSRVPSSNRSCAAWIFLLARRHRDAGVAGAVLHQGRDRQAPALRQQVGAAGRRRSARRFLGGSDRHGCCAKPRRSRRPCPMCTASRPMPAPPRPSTSTASCATTTCAASPSRAIVQITLKPKEERERTSHDIALELREKLKGLVLPEGTSIKVVEPPPGPPVLATLLAEIYGPDAETRRTTAAKVREAFEKVPFIVDVDDSYGVQTPRVRVSIDQDNLEYHKVRGKRCLRHAAGALCAVDGGLLASRRGPPAHSDQSRTAQGRAGDQTRRPCPRPLPANAIPGARDVVELGDVVRVGTRTVFVSDLPPQRPPGRDGDGGTGGCFRGAGLRHDRGEPRAGQHRLDRPREARDRAARPAARRVEARPAVGRRVGGDLGDLPRHGRGLPRGAARHLHAGGGASSAPSSCRW